MEAEDKRAVRESYDTLGGRLYDVRYRLEQVAKYDEILRHITLLPYDIVLDDGCGTGLLLEMLETHAVGVDLSCSLLSTACSRLKNGRRIHLIQADADQLPFRGGVFDKVFAVTLIQNTPEAEQTLKEMRRVAQASSEVAITALKKSFTLQGFKQLLNASGLTLRSLVQDEELKDWIAFATPQPVSIHSLFV